MNVQEKIEYLLTNNQYQELINYLETQLELEENLDYLSYLGLAYFLSGNEAEAQTAWFLIFHQENHNLLHQLTIILDREAHRQFKQENYQISYDLRQLIEEISPENIDNSLLMIESRIKLNLVNNAYLEEIKVLELIKKTKKQEINKEILYRVFGQILDFPFLINTGLTNAILDNQDGDQDFLNLVLTKARLISYQKKYPHYSADLALICLQYLPHDLGLLKETFWYCLSAYVEYVGMSSNYLEKGESIGRKFVENSQTLGEKAYGYYMLIYWMLTVGDWVNQQELVDQYIQSLSMVSRHPEELTQGHIYEALAFMSHYLLYFRDKPLKDREIINNLSSLQQQFLQKQHQQLLSCHSFKGNTQKQKIKIGYIGYTLRNHCVGILSRWLIFHLDRSKFEIYTYLIGNPKDEVTEKWFSNDVKKCTHLPRDVGQIIPAIKQDEIDILVDLDCFTSNTTQAVMALKPAPIQVSWLGLDSTGIPAIDYFVVDPHILPDNAQTYYQEKLWRLPHTYLAVDGFEIDSPSLRKEDLNIPENAMIYLSLQTGLKRHPDNIRLQMKILQQVPNSYFLVSGGTNEVMRSNVTKLFAQIAEEEGVNPERIKVLPFMPVNTYRGNLALGDVVLDTYPFNGATTTLDALWLNIPLVTRVGEQFHARQGYTFLTNLGIEEGIAWSDEEYIEWGVRFGMDEELRKKVYWKLKESKKTSPLWNAKQFAREMEKAYEQMWEIYVNSQR